MPLSKAQTLRLLAESRSSAFVIDPFVAFTVGEWRTSPTRILHLVQEAELGALVVVRSSATIEDADPELPPGLFHSQLNVRASQADALTAAVERVVESFARDDRARSAGEANQVIIQRQLVTAVMSGVLSTGPAWDLYFSVHYDDECGRTDCVTAGRACKRVDVLRDVPSLPEPWRALQRTVRAVERLLRTPVLIEFGISPQGSVHVFQARANRESTRSTVEGGSRMAVMSLIKQARSQLAARRELWSDMTDWNPAEMLGDRPRPLAVSLYQYLVTNEAWIRGRASLGYRYVTPSALVETIAGKPYVNVRRSFLSLTPASVPTELAQRLVEDRLEALAERPQLHDKVELDLLFTAADVAKPERTTCLLERGFSRSEVDELNAHLRTLTDSVLTNYARFQANDAQLIQELAGWCARCRPPRHERDLNALLSFVRAGLRNCRDQGVVPFARQARAAFIARDLLSRLTASSCIEAHWLDAWWRSLDTVAQRVTHAVVDLGEGRIARSDFDAAFGHLRARTYDICSPRYDQIQWMPSATMRCPARGDPPLLGSVERARIEEGLRGAGLHMSADEFLDFARGAMKAREETKFGFSLVLSDVLEALSLVGEAVGFSREDLSFLRIEDVTDPANEAATLADLRSRWQELVRSRHDLWATGLRVALSDFLSGAEDLLVARRYLARPNFVTRETVAADVTVLDSPAPSPGVTLSGKIVVTEAADPGFDWIFALGIAGLVTRYGGSVSHMAIRCGEFGLPAAIGCGDELFQRIARARRVLLDCADGRIEILE